MAYGPWGFLGFGDQAEKWNSDLGLPKEDLEETVREVLRKKGLFEPVMLMMYMIYGFSAPLLI